MMKAALVILMALGLLWGTNLDCVTAWRMGSLLFRPPTPKRPLSWNHHQDLHSGQAKFFDLLASSLASSSSSSLSSSSSSPVPWGSSSSPSSATVARLGRLRAAARIGALRATAYSSESGENGDDPIDAGQNIPKKSKMAGAEAGWLSWLTWGRILQLRLNRASPFTGILAAFFQHPVPQLGLLLLFYYFHLTVLTQHSWNFSHQLWPVPNAGHFTGVGWDSLAGMACWLGYTLWPRHRSKNTSPSPVLRPSTMAPEPRNMSPSSRALQGGGAAIALPPRAILPAWWSMPTRVPWKFRAGHWRTTATFFVTCILLIQAYLLTGRLSLFWEEFLYTMSAYGWPLTAPRHRAWTVLMGHLSWVMLGTVLLASLPRPPPFFGTGSTSTASEDVSISNHATVDNTSNKLEAEVEHGADSGPTRWFRWKWNRSFWLGWVVGGYCVSSWLFNVADLVNQYLLPSALLEQTSESVVSQLIQPENNDLIASVIGYIAPCLSAPVWEELLYRGFMLAGLTHALEGWGGRPWNYRWAVLIQAVIFSAHHMSLTAALPLAVLGWTWAVLYSLSGNLVTVVLIHALWNSRVFIGSWMGL